VYLDGQTGQSLKPLKPDFANGLYTEAYLNLFSATGKLHRDESHGITPSEFADGYTLYAYDLTPDLNEGDHFNLVKQGSVRVSMRFAEALPRAVTGVAYAEFEEVLEIDRSRNILLPFSS